VSRTSRLKKKRKAQGLAPKPKTAWSGVACPRCGSKQTIRGVDGWYTCHGCGGLFDDDPDEGGTHMNNPAGRMERGER
jgi:DNA-directed RNA polymerase subunit RPC12/RpoP